VWSLVIGGYFTWVSIYGINQTQVQRYLSVKKMSQAVKAIWWNVLGIGSLLLICAYGGLVMYAMYEKCDPLTTKQVQKKDQLFPLFVIQVMREYPGVPGLFVAGVFSGALSTVSSGLNSLAAVCLRDFIEGGCGIKLEDGKATYLSKALAIAFGIIGYLLIFVVKNIDGVLEAALGIFGIVGGPVLGAFTLGMFVPFATTLGAFVGEFTSLIFTMWMGFGQTASALTKTYNSTIWSPKMPTEISGCPAKWLDYNETIPVPPSDTFNKLALYEVSYMWFSAIACLWCVVVGILVSLAYKPVNHRRLDKRLISPGLRMIFSFWPNVVRKHIYQYLDQIGSEFDEKHSAHYRKEEINEDDNPKGEINMAYNNHHLHKL